MKKKMTKRTPGDKDTQIDKDLVFHSVSNASRFGEDLASLVRNGPVSRVHTDAKTHKDSDVEKNFMIPSPHLT